ncbi:MAG: hypothetical protein JWO62_1409 [Acidimicrobiaceae bacterium]|nr:hypothetical protein [Acidimicrobiaceae bacterium]
MPAYRPWTLAPNYVPQAYEGGGETARFRALDPSEQGSPEDWVASVTTRWALEPAGLTRLADGRYLREAIEQNPVAYLGADHVAAFGTDPGLLVKLLDAAERLNVHVHPDNAFARTHLGCAHGKTEAWIILSTVGEGEVYAGFTRDVGAQELATWVAEQSVDAMLGALHKIRVSQGSAVLVPAGVPHAIGPGVLVLELQQPTDFSIMLERRSSPGGELGLGWDLALQAVDRSQWDERRLQQLIGPGTLAPGRVLPPIADPFFRADVIAGAGGGQLAQGFAVVVGLSGSGKLSGDFEGEPLPISRGTTVLVPFAAGPTQLSGDVEAAVCRPAAPRADRPDRPVA